MLGAPLGHTAFGHPGGDEGPTIQAIVTNLVLTGRDVDFLKDSAIQATVTNLSLTAYDTDFDLVRALIADTTHLVITPYNAGPNLFGAETTSLSITPYDVNFARQLPLVAAVTSLAITPYDVNFAIPRSLEALTTNLSIGAGTVALELGTIKDNLMDAIRIREAIFTLEPRQNLSSIASGGTRGEDLGPPKWRATVTSRVEGHDDLSSLMAEIYLLDGVRNTFYISNPKKPGPRADRDGAILGSSTVQIAAVSGETISLKGLPANYVLSRGDFLHFDIGSPAVRVLHILGEDVTANGSGVTDAFRVRPAPFIGTAADLTVTLIEPSAEMMIVPGTVQVRQSTVFEDTVSFEAEQVLA